MKVFTVLVVVATLFIVEGKISKYLKDALVEELLDEYEKREDDFDPRFCADTGLNCYKCPECHDNLQFGMCVAGVQDSGKCLCKWGWTGPNPKRVYVANEVSKWSRNRIRAENCKKPCHYTHDVWNPKCIGQGGGDGCKELECKLQHGGYAKCINGKCVPDCDPVECAKQHGKCEKGICKLCCDEMECAARGGKCFEGVCKIKCCRGASGPNHIYVAAEDTYYADNCNSSCPYLGTGVENPDCSKEPTYPPPCDPKCKLSAGECNYETGKCKCCKDFSGPNPVYNHDNHTISADYCDTYCPYVRKNGKHNYLCLNDNYIKRSTAKITFD